MKDRKSVQAGACGFFPTCVLEAHLCPPGETFRSSREISQKVAGTHGGACADGRNVKHISTSVGRCGTEGGCVNVAEACFLGAGEIFIDDVASGCTIVSDANDADSKTLYGSCDSRCSWSPSDCGSGEVWNTSSENCPCDKVRVGACDKEGDIFCAVSEKACDASSKWVTALELISHSSNTDCFLCREPALGLSPQQTAGLEIEESTLARNNLSLAGYITGGIIVVLSLLGFGVFAFKKRSVFKLKNCNKGEAQTIPPVTTVTRNAYDDDDDVSVL